MKVMKNGMMGAIDIALIRLDHVPFVVTNNRKMAVWTDVKEIMLWCPSPQCSVVLDALKVILGYPAYERAMHPCSQLEQLMFLKHFMFVTHGTLLVDIESLRDGAKLALLYNMVREKHTRPDCQTAFNCTNMLKTFSDKYSNTSFKIPLSSASAKNLLPAVKRISKNVSSVQVSTNNQACGMGFSGSHELPTTMGNDGGEVAERNRQAPYPQTAHEGNISRTLVPLALLCKLYPGCEGFLDEVVRLYVLGQCEDKNLQSVCQCTVEEGIQLTRFLASQNGYEKFWLCLTTCSLMMSWFEFWHGYERICRGGIDVLAGNVCVVSLNCQTTDMRQKDKVIDNKKKTTAPCRQTLPTQPSPSLSTINDITANVQSQNRNGPLAILSAKSQSLLLEDTAYCECDQNFEADNKTMTFEKDVPTEETEGTVESSNCENDVVTEKSNKCNDKDDANVMGNEKQSQLKGNEIKDPGKRGKKKLNGSDERTTSRRQRNIELDGPRTDDKSVSELSNSEKTKQYKTRRKGKQVKAGKEAAELRIVSKSIKSRLRSRNQEGRIHATDMKTIISKEDANNSAMLNVMSSSLQRSGSGDSKNSKSKSVEIAESGHPGAEEGTEVSKPGSLPSQYTPARMELPMSEVSPYDLTSMKYPQMEGIHVSITSKNEQCYIHTDNIPGEISPDLPLFEKRNIEKTKNDNLQSIRNGRELLKISSAQIQDEIPVSFKYIPNSPVVKASFSPTAEQACSVTRNKRRKDTKSGPVSQDVDKFVKANKLEYISLTPKQLELAGPMLRCPDPGIVQRSKTIPYKPIKATEETARKNRTEAVINRLKTDLLPAVLQGKTYQHKTTINSCKLGKSSADEQMAGFDSPKVEPFKYPVSPSKTRILNEEMAYTLQKRAFNSFSSVLGNQDEEQLAAEGKAVKHFDRTKDLNSSEFLKERITMWKNEVEQSINHSPGRLTKSADLVRRRNMCTYRPRSSIYSSRFTQADPRGPSIKTALCSLFSRDRASPDMLDEQIHFQTSADETNEMRDSEKLRCEYSNNYMPLYTPITSKGRRSGQTKHDYQYDVQNYGSSSSVTPDIYDEFARKRKQKPLRPEIVQIKPKPVTTPFPSVPSQPVVRKQQQSNLQMSRKPNYHAVVYMSSAEISNQEKEGSSSYINPDIKQMYRYTNTVPSQNLPHYSQTKVSISPKQMDSISTNPHFGKDSKMTDFDENQDLVEDEQLFEHQCLQTSSGIHVAQSLPHEVVSSSSVKSIGKDKSVVQINRDGSRENSFPPLSQTIKLDKNTHDDCIQGYNKGEKCKEHLATEDSLIVTTFSTTDRKNNISSAMNKLSSFLDCIVTPSKVESLEYINNLQALTGASARKCQSEVNTTNTEIRNNETRSGSQQGVIKSQRSKSDLRPEENKLFDQRPREHVLSKVDTQLYYTVPGDDMFYPVSENMIIPRYAQFFVQTDETESVKGKQLYLDQDTRLENDLSESGDKETGKESETNEGIGTLHADSNSNEEKMSSTTFDSIIKATEDFIDRSRLIKNVISKTKQAIESTEADEDDATLDNQTEVQEISGNNAEQIEERDEGDYPKVIMPSAGQTVENQSTSRKKSFKEIIEEKREEKRKIQLDMSRKKYWNSAHAKKDGNTHLSIENKFYKQRNGDQSGNGRAKGDLKQKNESVKHEAKIDNQKIKQNDNQRQINSKFVVASQRRPKTCIGCGKGSITKDVSSAGRKRIKDISRLGTRSHTSFAAKQKHDRVSTVNRSKYQQLTKAATIFPRSKRQLPKESDDCTSKILTALRRLSIEKFPKTAEQKGSSKQEVRQNKLRDCLAKQIPLGRLVKVPHTDTANDPERDKTPLIKDSGDVNEVHDYQNKDEVEHVFTGKKTQFSKIPVLIGLRKDINDDVSEEHEYCDERNENVERFAVDLHDFTVQETSHSVTEQVDRKFSEYEINMQQDKSESDINQEAAINKETFITLYDTRELALYRPGSATQKSTSNSSVDVGQMNEEKYLGIPYFQDANSNMNNVEYKVPVVNLEPTNCFRSDSNLLEKESGQMTQLTNEELYNMNFFPNKIVDVNDDDPFEQIATVSTTSIRNGEYQNQQDLNIVGDQSWKVESTTEGIQHVGADLKACADNIFQGDQTLFQDMPYVKQGILDSENAEQLNDKCLDPNWLHITFSQNIVGNPQDGYYLAQADAKHEYNDNYYSEGTGKHQGHEHFTYVSYDVLKAVGEQSGRGINIIESNIENGSSPYTSETEPYHHDQLVGADENLTNIYFCKPVIPGSMMQQAGDEVFDNTVSGTHLKENTERVDIHLEDPIYEDLDHCYQIKYSAGKCEEQGNENLYSEANCLNDCDNGDFFLDETDCGEEVYIGDNETDDRDIPDLENGIFNISESELVNNIVTQRKSNSEMSFNDYSKDNQKKDIDNLEKISCLLKENSGTEKKPEEQKEGNKVNSPFNKDINTIAHGGRKKSVCRDKETQIKQKPKKEKTKFVIRNQLGKSEHIKTVEKYSPSQSEVEAYFEEVSKRTGIDDIPISKNKQEDNAKMIMNYNSDTDSESGNSLPEFSQDFSITGVCLNKSECNETTENDSVKTDEKQDRYNEHLRLYNDDEANDGDIDDDGSDDDDDDGDDENDDDYNPEADFKELEEYSDYSVSDGDTCEKGNSDSIDNTRRKNLKKAQTCTKVNKRHIDFALKKKCRISLEKVRQSFQKKYDIKNSSSIRGWKKKSQKADKEHEQKMGSKMSTSNRKSKERENSVVREFCLKKLNKNNDTPDKRESDNDIYLNNFMKSHSRKKQIGTESTDSTCLISSSKSNIKLKETVDSNGSKNMGMDEENEDKYKITETDYKNVQKTRKKKRGKKTTNDDAQDEIDKSEDEMRKQKDENMAAEGFIKTQKRYYEILRNSAVGVDREDIEHSDEQSVEEIAVDKLSEVIEAVPVHGERVITKALSDAEKALEGTGSLEDIRSEDEGAVIEDLINQCSYQMIEDEDHVQLGGVAHFKDFALPFVYINGYKYTPLRDTLTIFLPECCVSACTIPRSVLQKHRSLVKSFSTWEQVYKLELIKMKKGPAIMTGDMLIKLDTFLTLLPELIQQIVELHVGTKLKRSKKCDINAYKILKSKFM